MSNARSESLLDRADADRAVNSGAGTARSEPRSRFGHRLQSGRRGGDSCRGGRGRGWRGPMAGRPAGRGDQRGTGMVHHALSREQRPADAASGVMASAGPSFEGAEDVSLLAWLHGGGPARAGRDGRPGAGAGGVDRSDLDRGSAGPDTVAAASAGQRPAGAAGGDGDRCALLRRGVRPQDGEVPSSISERSTSTNPVLTPGRWPGMACQQRAPKAAVGYADARDQPAVVRGASV